MIVCSIKYMIANLFIRLTVAVKITILALSTNIGTSDSHYRETRCVVYGQQHDVNRYRQEKNEIDLIPDDVEEPNLLINMNEKRKGCLK